MSDNIWSINNIVRQEIMFGRYLSGEIQYCIPMEFDFNMIDGIIPPDRCVSVRMIYKFARVIRTKDKEDRFIYKFSGVRVI